MPLMDLDTGAGFLKAGFLGLAGSGKTQTAMRLAIGVRAHFKLDGPIAMADTEGGAVYVAPMVKAATGLGLRGIRSRSLDDAKAFLRSCVDEGVSVAILDSVTHFWREVCETYLKRINAARERKRIPPLDRLEFQHWSAIKSSEHWGEFSDLFLTLPLHLIVCGREGYDYDFEARDDGSGKKDLVKTGVKMKTEGEFGYEPSLLVRMEQEQDMVGGELRGIAHRATVLKDRFGILDGCDVAFHKEDPPDATFEFFRPHVELLTPGSVSDLDTTRRSDVQPDEAGNVEWHREKRDREIICEEIKGEFVKGGMDGTSNDAKKARVATLEECFGTSSWTAVENMNSGRLREGLAAVRAKTGGVK